MTEKYPEQLSHLQKPDEKEIPGELQELFDKATDDQVRNWGFINNLFRVLPLNARQYKGFLDFKNSLFDEDHCYLSNVEKEMIGLVVSSTNGCTYCLTTHGDYLRGLTKDPVWVDKLCYNYRSAELNHRQRALCDFAYFLTAYPREITTEWVDRLREAGLNDHEILEASYIVGFFNYTNRWVAVIGPKPNDGHYSHNR